MTRAQNIQLQLTGAFTGLENLKETMIIKEFLRPEYKGDLRVDSI